MTARKARASLGLAASAAFGLLSWGSPLTGAAQSGAASTPPAATTPAAPATAPGTTAPSAAAAVPADRPPGSQTSESFDLERALVATDRGFTSDDAGKRARERAPQIASARAAADSARAESDTQSANYYPQVSVAAQYKRIKYVNTGFSFEPPLDPTNPNGPVVPAGEETPALDFSQPVDNYSLTATARWPVSDLFLRVYPTHKAARTIAEARDVEVEARAASAELTAREAFYAHARALAAHAVADQALKQAEAQAQQAKLFVDAGTAAPVDFMTATARVESMRAALARTSGSVAVTRNSLATLMGIPTAEVTAIRERVTALPEPPTANVDTLLKRGLDQRAELRAMRKMIGANDLLKIAERNAVLPVLSVEGNNLYANPNPRYVPPRDAYHNTWEVSATVSWSPNNALVGYRRTQKAAADVERARADLLALEDGVRIEVVQSFEDYKAADAAARASQEQQKAAEETYRVRLATYRVGAGVQIDLLTADLALTQARLDHVNAVLDARISLARLARATGGPVH